MVNGRARLAPRREAPDTLSGRCLSAKLWPSPTDADKLDRHSDQPARVDEEHLVVQLADKLVELLLAERSMRTPYQAGEPRGGRHDLRSVQPVEPRVRARCDAVRRLAGARPSLARIAIPPGDRQVLVLHVVKLTMQSVESVRHRVPRWNCKRLNGAIASNRLPTKRKSPRESVTAGAEGFGLSPFWFVAVPIVTSPIQPLVSDSATVLVTPRTKIP